MDRLDRVQRHEKNVARLTCGAPFFAMLAVQGGSAMNIRVEHAPGEVQVILRGPEDSAELLRILAMLEQDATRL